jgi:magnesium transporter
MSDSPTSNVNAGGAENLLDLDDHRLQPVSLPRLGPGSLHSRRGTATSAVLTPIMSVDEVGDDGLLHATVARDFEHAIDDNASVISNGSVRGERQDQFRRARHGSSLRSRQESPSPPTSVHAFAGRRRRDRSNTINTINTNDGHSLRNEPSVDGFHRRRLTFSDQVEDAPANDDDAKSSSTDTSAENDVCYPQDMHPEEGPEIDFEELDEFVAETAQTGMTPATPGMQIPSLLDTSLPLELPPAALENDAFDELEKVKLTTSSDRRFSQTGAQRPFYTFFTSDSEDTIHSTTLGGLLADGETFSELFSAHSADGSWWLDVIRPSEEEVTVLCKAFGVHPLTREDITTEESREKVELFRHYYFVAFRSFEKNPGDEDYLEPLLIYAVVFRQGIMTFSHRANNHADNVFKRIGRLRDYMQISTDWIAYALIDDIVDGFMPVIREIDKEVDTIEDSVFTARDSDARVVFPKIGEARRKVMALLRLLGGKSDVIKGFAKRCNEHYKVAPTGDVGMYLSDIQDHIVTMRDNLSHSEQLLGRIHTNYLAQINLDGIDSGNRTNRMLGKVTLFATILVPCNLITGLFGMNVAVP